ncbi:3535_t:CDS:1 [Paraglomus brasilianum]|uniref:3535_t:CDS:1 n=1 Tax=Paraglomus brasilianum TaxID=144538 RepID=A0A9N8ZXH0_9GLOM|nr:3535_t:CDS:1 [Paraglomus brasilianum]
MLPTFSPTTTFSSASSRSPNQHQSIKVLLYVAVVSVFVRAAMIEAIPGMTHSSAAYDCDYGHLSLDNDAILSQVSFGYDSNDYDTQMVRREGGGVVGTLLAGAKALLNGFA